MANKEAERIAHIDKLEAETNKMITEKWLNISKIFALLYAGIKIFSIEGINTWSNLLNTIGTMLSAS
ncbi:MAG: hypothetical protein COA84_14115 [Robiginitomaculum sp.]|nr:MAG: hypothetical protein COA84_14115 [Robiginitomaculum sp.]